MAVSLLDIWCSYFSTSPVRTFAASAMPIAQKFSPEERWSSEEREPRSRESSATSEWWSSISRPPHLFLVFRRGFFVASRRTKTKQRHTLLNTITRHDSNSESNGKGSGFVENVTKHSGELFRSFTSEYNMSCKSSARCLFMRTELTVYHSFALTKISTGSDLRNRVVARIAQAFAVAAKGLSPTRNWGLLAYLAMSAGDG